jgi:hypothetical protein
MISVRLQRLVDRHGGRCHLCGGLVHTEDPDHPGFPSRDHITPRRDVPKGTPGEVLLAHRICNSYRGSRLAGRCDMEEFGRRYRKAVAEYEARTLLVDGVYSVG